MFLPGAAAAGIGRKITVTDPWSYAELAENVEAWGFRYIQDEGRFATVRRSLGDGSRRSTRRW